MNSFKIEFFYHGVMYKGWVNPSKERNHKNESLFHEVELNDKHFGTLYKEGNLWKLLPQDQTEFAQVVGECIANHEQQMLSGVSSERI